MFGTQEGLLYHFQWSKLLGLDMHTQFLAATRVPGHISHIYYLKTYFSTENVFFC